jgi:hypothetical protein
MKNMIHSFISFLRYSRKTILLILVVALLSVFLNTFVSVMLSNAGNLTVPSAGNIKTVGVEAYWDQTCENETESINWGTIVPGTSKTVSLSLRSISNVKTILNLNATNFDPIEVSEGITLSWDYDGDLLNPNEIIEVTFVLYFSAEYEFTQYLINEQIDAFSFDVYISAT